MPASKLAEKLRKLAEKDSKNSELLTLSAEMLEWQDTRYRNLSVMVWGSQTSEPIFQIRPLSPPDSLRPST